MNITIEGTDKPILVIKLKIEKSDYEAQLEKKLKENQRKAVMPGFRPGKVPLGLIQKLYRKPVLAEELNKLISENLNKYLTDNKLEVLCEPLPSEKQETLDLDYAENFDFAFDVALYPEIQINLNKNIKLPFYHVTITDEMIDDEMNILINRMGKEEETETVGDKSRILFDLNEADEMGNEIEGYKQFYDLKCSIERIENEDTKNQLLGKTIGDTVIIDINKSFPNDTDLSYMLNIRKEEIKYFVGTYQLTIKEIKQFVPAELNQEFFDKVFTPGVVTSEDEMKTQIKEDFEKKYRLESGVLIQRDSRKYLMSNIEVPLPEEFIKRWLKLSRKEGENVPEEEIPNFMEEMKWTIIIRNIFKINSLTVSEEDINKYVEKLTRLQYFQYGVLHISDEYFHDYVANMFKKNEEKIEKFKDGAVVDKVTEFVKNSVTLENVEVNKEDFYKLFDEV
jgi:trigger factor